MKRVLIAGATGYLGRFATKAFKEQGYHVRILVRNSARLDKPGPFLEPAIRSYADEIFTGEATKPETLDHLCDGIDSVFSSLGLTRQKDGLTFRDVDYGANANILRRALDAGVRKFIYVSVFNASQFEHLAIIKAHEDFVRELRASPLHSTIIRPTGYFSDMSEFLRMARSGWVFLVGNGNNRLNPIHGADLAEVCVDAVESSESEIPVGGPDIFSQNEIAAIAFSVLDRRQRLIHIPSSIARLAVGLIRPFSRQTADLADFFLTAGTADGIAHAHGTRTLRAYFEEIRRAGESK